MQTNSHKHQIRDIDGTKTTFNSIDRQDYFSTKTSY